jgi:hypothetical protein
MNRKSRLFILVGASVVAVSVAALLATSGLSRC